MSILNAPEGLVKALIVKYDLFEVDICAEYAERKEICEGSDGEGPGHSKCHKKTKAGFCGECGCLIEAKVLINTESCPLGKW
jgi:hypothetical protein